MEEALPGWIFFIYHSRVLSVTSYNVVCATVDKGESGKGVRVTQNEAGGLHYAFSYVLRICLSQRVWNRHTD